MENKELFVNVLFPALSGVITWIAARWYERRKFRAETDSLIVGNTRTEIENYKLVAAEWRETATAWKNMVDEYQTRLVENAEKIDKLVKENLQLKHDLALLKEDLSKAQCRINELENKSCNL